MGLGGQPTGREVLIERRTQRGGQLDHPAIRSGPLTEQPAGSHHRSADRHAHRDGAAQDRAAGR